ASAPVANLNSGRPFVDPTPSCTSTPFCTATPVPDCSVVRPTATGTPDINAPHCTPTPSWTTSPAPTITPIPVGFQPPNRVQGTLPLAWRPFTPAPIPTPTPPWPTILVIHGGGFKQGAPFPHVGNETEDIENVANDLADAGYYVLVVAYRLAPPGLIPGQTRQDDAHDPNHISGFAPYQEYDVEALVKAARRDPHVRGRKVGIIGGSAGATHAIW